MEKYTHADLLLIFGAALRAKFLQAPTRHQIPGKHHAFRSTGPKPAGFKLLRKFYGSGDRSFSGVEVTTGKRAICRFADGCRNRIVVQVNDQSDPRSKGWHHVDPWQWEFCA